jgi:DNA repair protein RadC
MDGDRRHYLAHRQRLRQRFLRHRLERFADYEVIELLLTLAIPRAAVKPQAKALLARFGNVRGVVDASLADLQPF